tara:strand:+ start:1567 stop:2328 length:762 start_codon:yes stop_codon:yes gene_type:complete
MTNFGNIKDTFNNILSESILSKNNEGKKLFKKYIQVLKEDSNLKKEYLIYKNLTTKKFNNESDAKDYIKENINLLKNNNPSKGIKKLNSILGDKKLVNENDEIYKHINILRNTKKTPNSLEKIQESLNFFKERMLKEEIVVENEYDTTGVPPSVLTKLAVNKFNNKYENITEEEKNIIKNILNGNDEDKEETYTNLKNECIDIIDNRLTENSDLDLKDKLLKVKDKLLRTSFNKETFPTDIDSIYNLKNSVTE